MLNRTIRCIRVAFGSSQNVVNGSVAPASSRPRLAAAAWFSLLGLGVLGGGAPASGQQILETYGTTLTTYKYATASGGQNVRPRFDQRGVGLDGSARAGSMFGWALAGNPLGEGSVGAGRLGQISLATGSYHPAEVDLALPAPGNSRWVVGRSWNLVQEVGGSRTDSNGYQGKNWFQMSQPEVALFSGATKDLDVVYLIYGSDRYIEFQRTGVSSNEFKGKNGAAGVVQHVKGSPDTYVYYDQRGNATTFFGFNTSGGAADGQIWKIVDPSGNAAYVGDKTTASTAVTNGYTSKRITKAYDGADNDGRRYTYTYTTIDGVSRLTQVKAEVKTGGTWSSPTGVSEVGKVDYAYYQTGDNANGDNGNLKTVTITTPLSPASTNLVRTTYYRYYVGAYNASTNPGYSSSIKMVLDAEGTRSYDWQDSTFDADYAADSDASIKPYASAYFEYENAATQRISKTFFNGQCGCGGGSGTNGVYEITYGDASGYATAIANTTYDTAWGKRTIVKRPDNTWETSYFDEVGQGLSRVTTDADPSGSPTKTWVTEVVRNSDGQVSEVHTPANITGYTHSTGVFTRRTSAGLITEYSRVASGDTEGFVQTIKWKEGDSGTAYYARSLTLGAASKTVGSYTYKAPLVTASNGYVKDVTTAGTAGTDYYASSLTNTMHGGGAELALKQHTSTNPTVTIANNGSGAATAAKRYARKDGTTAITESADGIFTYNKLDGKGLLSTRIADAQTNSADFAAADDPSGTFGITETGTGLHIKTTYTYDAQGRPDETTLPSGRVTKMYYTVLADRRMVTISIPRYVAGGTLTYYGPVSYAVTNHAGGAEFQGTIAIWTSGTTTALSSWISTGGADPITAVSGSVGPVGAMSTSVYTEAGTKLAETRSYFLVPASGTGTEGSGGNYDAARFAYDTMGRRWRVKSADGTISRTVFDELGRATESWTGTNDVSFSGGEPSGTDNMVKTSTTTYDGGSAGGNSLVTSRTLDADGNWATTTDQRVTSYTNDARGRAVVITNPQAPHVLSKYDAMGRTVATGLYSSAGSLTITSDPTTVSSSRMGLSQTFYDERGQVWKSQRHKIDDADGSDDDNLQTLTWYDAAGRTIKVDGEQLTKTTYDRLGRATNQFVLASDNDTVYADADDVTGDYVLEESQTYYKDTGSGAGGGFMRVHIARHYDDTTTTGALDTDTDLSLVDYSGSKIKGRAQISVMFYDAWDRVSDTVAYGTNAGGNYDRDSESSAPARSDTALVTTSAYDADGHAYRVTDPRGIISQTVYDDAGRRTATIANYVNGTPSGSTADDDVIKRYVYGGGGHMTQMWVDLDGDGTQDAGTDQVTVYTYGVAKGTSAGDSNISSNALLQKVTYPDSGGSSDVVTFAYNALGQEMWKKDQAGNVVETDYDTAGRISHKRATTINTAGGFDDAVKRITLAYDTLGRTSTVTQYDHAAVGSGTITDEVKHTYEDWGNIEKIEQDRDGAVTGGGNDYEVAWTYAKATGGRNTVRRYDQTLPGSVTYVYNYGSGINENTSRVYRIENNFGTPYVTYSYNGVGQVVRTYLEEPDAFYDQDGTTARTYTDLDRFNRVIGSAWTKDLSTDRDFYSLTLNYDRNSNITDITDNVLKNGVSGNRNFDVQYGIDNLNRVTRADEGTFASGSISNRSRDEQWTLTQTGNWDRAKVDLNGDGDFTDAGETDDTRTHNVANEMLTRDTDTSGSVNYTLTHDAVGNLTDDGQSYKFVYDVWGRLRMIKNQSNNLVAEYRSNGLNQRLSWHYDTDADGDCDASDKYYYFAYDDQWRVVATFRDSDTSPKERFLYHATGLGGWGRGGAAGGIGGYIDHVIFRDRDINSGWTNAADGTLEERMYYCQNWRADISAILTSAGKMVEWIKYSAYGTPTALPTGDTDSDGDYDLTDLGNMGGGYEIRKDAELDGDVDGNDVNYAIANGYQTLGRGVLSSSYVGNRKGYAGYENDGAIVRFAHVRNRVFDSTLGRWTRRDPLGYVDGMGLYEYVASMSVINLDPTGLTAVQCSSGAMAAMTVLLEGLGLLTAAVCKQAAALKAAGYAIGAIACFLGLDILVVERMLAGGTVCAGLPINPPPPAAPRPNTRPIDDRGPLPKPVPFEYPISIPAVIPVPPEVECVLIGSGGCSGPPNGPWFGRCTYRCPGLPQPVDYEPRCAWRGASPNCPWSIIWLP